MDSKWRAFLVLLLDKIIKWTGSLAGTLLVLYIVAGFTS